MKDKLLALAIVSFVAVFAFRSTLGAQQAQPAQQTPPQTAPPQEPPAQPAPAASIGAAPKSVWEGAYTEEQAKRGGAVYAQDCSTCHGAELEGMDMSPPLSGPAFTANWNELSVGDLFERIRISMPMDRPGKLTRQQNADVVAFLLSANRFPAGKTELDTQLPLLKQIVIQATKPEAKNPPPDGIER